MNDTTKRFSRSLSYNRLTDASNSAAIYRQHASMEVLTKIESKAEAFFGVLLACAIGIGLALVVAYSI